MTKAKNNLLDEILDDTPLVSMISEEDQILNPMIEEINMINDEGVKSFVRSILVRADSFWKIPSSFSGKYHPMDEHNEGGNMLHTKRVARAAKVLCDSHGVSAEEFDLVMAACLLHDITKGKLEKDGSFAYDKMHPYTVGDFVKFCQEDDRKHASDAQSSTLFLNEEDVQTILRLVRCHLGPWSPIPETVPITYLDMIVHMADNIASKVHYIVDGDNVIEQRWKLDGDSDKD
jgi:HD superfamily phosphohydrolase YqeK